MARGIACDFFEQARKVVCVIDADLAADLCDRRVAGCSSSSACRMRTRFK